MTRLPNETHDDWIRRTLVAYRRLSPADPANVEPRIAWFGVRLADGSVMDMMRTEGELRELLGGREPVPWTADEPWIELSVEGEGE